MPSISLSSLTLLVETLQDNGNRHTTIRKERRIFFNYFSHHRQGNPIQLVDHFQILVQHIVITDMRLPAAVQRQAAPLPTPQA